MNCQGESEVIVSGGRVTLIICLNAVPGCNSLQVDRSVLDLGNRIYDIIFHKIFMVKVINQKCLFARSLRLVVSL
jgi:hypothetical protein